jgi:hypothetical protein
MTQNLLKRNLIEDVVNNIHKDPWRQIWRKKPTGVEANGWPERLHYYCLATKSNPDFLNHLVWLHNIVEKVRHADVSEIKTRHSARCKFAIDILEWGGVTRGNTARVPAAIDAVIDTVQNGTRFAHAPMNSGWTKIAAVYSLILSGSPPQIIWDSRVSLSVCTRLGNAAKGRGMDPAAVRKIFGGRLGWVAGRGGRRARLMALAKVWFPNRYGKWDAHFEGGAVVAEMAQILNANLSFYGKPDQSLTKKDCEQLKNLGIQPPKKWNPWLVACVLFMDGQ